MDFGLGNRRALVCASTSGLGLACAQALAREGARVVITGRRRDVAIAEAARLEGGVGIQADLTEPGDLHRLVEEVQTRVGSVDILVLNSGGPPGSLALSVSDDEMLAAFSLVLLPAVRLVRLLVPSMQARRWGRVVAIGSSGVQQPIPGLATSNAARASLAAYLKTLAGEVAADGVTVNMIIPGRLATDRVRSLDEARALAARVPADSIRQQSVATIPIGRYGEPGELGQVAAFLASNQASFITGSMVRVDGGMITSIH